MYKIDLFDINSHKIKDFIEVAKYLYSNDTYYTGFNKLPARDYNTKVFIMKRDNIPVARACAIINPDISYNNLKTGLIGFYESEDNLETARKLFEEIIEYFKKEGIKYLIGPLNGSTWHSYRLTVASNNKPFFLDNYNKPWYTKQFFNNEFKVIARYHSSLINSLNVSLDRLKNFELLMNEKGVIIRSMDLNNFKDDLKKVYEVSVESFINNFLYTPVSFDEFYNMYKEIKTFMDPEFSLIAESKEGKPYGFIFALENLFEKNKKSLVIKTVAVVPDKKIKGLGTYLVERIHHTALKNNYSEVFHTLMHEKNSSRNILKNISHPYHLYLLFGRNI
ncbi:MAG: hypothetical protein AB1782_18555 [Cyanobacteriota bacterium]